MLKEKSMIVCTNYDCRQEKSEDHYYKRNDKPMIVCKECMQKEFKERGMLFICQKYDLPYLASMWFKISQNKKDDINILSEYMKMINSLTQYRKLTYKDSTMEDINKEDKSFDEQTIESLEFEAKQLQQKIREARDSENWGTYKNLAQNLEIALRLLDERKGMKKPEISYCFNIDNVKLDSIYDKEEFMKFVEALNVKTYANFA
jgi:hypothetical protein